VCLCAAVLQEGELRPQLLDRFGMSVNVSTITDVAARTKLVLDRCVWGRGHAAGQHRVCDACCCH
jgi:Mg-chelatase subunit ChlI